MIGIETIVAGDTLDFTVAVPDYPASAGWTLKYRLTPRFTTPTQAAITLTAATNANGADYDVQSAPAATALWKAGAYTWARWVEKSGARQTLSESGSLEVKDDPSATVQGFDGRTDARIIYDQLVAAQSSYSASQGAIQSYTIGTRQMTFKSAQEFIKQIDYWKAKVLAEENAARIAAGLRANRVVFRF